VIDMHTENLKASLEHQMDIRSLRFGIWLYRKTHGRAPHLWHRRALVLTTTGRRSGRPRTVMLQFFPDGSDLIVVAANSGMPTHPAWYLNLKAHPWAHVEVEGRQIDVRAEELSPAEADAHWPRVLEIAPDYAKYTQRTTRRIPLVRLVGALE
jgi:deazaflavin-dependent oxidoreductase (nitroreductase family)